MRVVSKARLKRFWESSGHQDAEGPLRAWYTHVNSKTVSWLAWGDVSSKCQLLLRPLENMRDERRQVQHVARRTIERQDSDRSFVSDGETAHRACSPSFNVFRRRMKTGR